MLTGSANLSLAAFEGRQHEVHVAFDGEPAWQLFDGYYQRDWKDSVPIEPDALIASRADGTPAPRATPLALNEVPIVRVLNAGIALVDQPPRPMPAGFAADALRQAASIGAELKDLALPKDKAGRTVVNAASVLRVLRSHQARPLGDLTEDRIPRADIDFATGIVHLDGVRWLAPDEPVPAEAVANDARILTEYLTSFRAFFGNASGAVEVYWAFLVWLYAAPAAPYLRQAAVPVGIDPWVYPVYAVLFGRSSGGKTLFTRIAARSMFGFEKIIRSGQFTANRALGLRERLGAIPLLIDDVTRDKFTRPCGRNPSHAFLADSRIGACSNHCVTGIRELDMLTGMTERDWLIALEVFDAVQSSRGQPGRDDRKFLEAIHYFTVHSISWRALPDEFGNWNSVWKRFWRLSRSGVFEAFFQVLAECSETAHLIQFFDSTTARAHVSAAGAKGGSSIRPSAARVAASRPRSTSRPISTGVLSTSI